MILNNSIWQHLVATKKIKPPLKTYVDSLLFYFLGNSALNVSDYRSILEIGVGGSTHLLHELAHRTNSTLNLVDNEVLNKIDSFISRLIPPAQIISYKNDSRELLSSFSNISYIHLDGSKMPSIVSNDMAIAYRSLSKHGLICHDDYGNNRWPAVTIETLKYVLDDKLKFVLIGDSSAWLCKTEDHSMWLEYLTNNIEFNWLLELCNGTLSNNAADQYFYLNSTVKVTNRPDKSYDKELYQSKLLLYAQAPYYLVMPYGEQSRAGMSMLNSTL